MEELKNTTDHFNVLRSDNQQLVPNFKPLVLKFTKNHIKKCWNIIQFCSVHLCLLVMVVSGEVTKTTVVVKSGDNISLPCSTSLSESSIVSLPQLSWRHHGKLNISATMVTKQSGALFLIDTSLADEGKYSCMAGDQIIAEVELKVYDVPSRISKILVSSNSVYSTVSWTSPTDGGYPILGYICQHKQDTSHILIPIPENEIYSVKNLSTDSRTCDLYNLVPNTTYYVRVAAYNKLGRGEFNSQITSTKPLKSMNTHSSLQTSESGYGRVLAMSIAVSVIALATLGSGIALLMIKHRGHTQPVRPLQESPGEDESLELVPHITLNPSFNIDMLEHITPDFNENSEHAFLVGSPTGRER